jgi:hypothetical protein
MLEEMMKKNLVIILTFAQNRQKKVEESKQ